MNALKRVLGKSQYKGLKPLNPIINKDNTYTTVTQDGRTIDKLKKPIDITLIGKEELATDTFVYRFALPDQQSTLGHETCQYLEFQAEILNKETGLNEIQTRFYHPLSKVVDNGYVDLLIKVYLRNLRNPQGGLFTQYIDRMQEGGMLKITGIGGDLVYQGNQQFLMRNAQSKEMEKRRIKNVGMIAGGSGIAPMFQLIQTVADQPNDLASLSLIYSNRTPFDIVLDEDLTEYEKSGKLYYFPLVQSPDENWTLGTGKVSQKMIESLMPPKNRDDSMILICGNQQLRAEVLNVLKEMDYRNYFVYT